MIEEICENCKYFRALHEKPWGECASKEVGKHMMILVDNSHPIIRCVHKDFGCIFWEDKNERKY